MSADYIKSTIITIPDYPKPGIQFRDITSVLENPQAFGETISLIAERYKNLSFNKIAGTEARGFLFGAPLAIKMGIGFIPVRKPNKLPREVISESYQLEYGEDTLEVHKDSISTGDKVLLVDDLLATGGTMLATATLIRNLGGIVEHAAFVVNLPDIGGEQRLTEFGLNTFAICEFDGD